MSRSALVSVVGAVVLPDGGATETSADGASLLDAYTPCIPERPLSEAVTSERLARRWFATVQRGAYDELEELVHEDVELVSKVRPGTTVHGRNEVIRFIEAEVAPNLFEASTEVFTPLDDERVIVEGRLRWIDEERVIRDDPVIWAVEFRDELLRRFLATRTRLEAEAALGRHAESDAGPS